MKTKKCFLKSKSAKLFLVLPITFLVLVVFSLNASGQKTTKVKTEVITPPPPPPPPLPQASDKESKKGMKDGAYQVVDEMPVFPGGDVALLKYIGDSTRYPKEAEVNAIQGKVIARFMVKADGSVSDVSILKGVNPFLDKEAVRVVGTLPKFTPGKLKGVNVPVWYMIPIEFSLK